MSPSLKGKNAIITGGSRGIGFSISQQLVSEGAKVVICSRTKSDLKKALKLLNEKETVAYGKVCDISKLSGCKKLIKFSQGKLNRIDILVNNAGIYGPIGPFEKTDLKFWRKTIEINLLGMVYLTHLIIPLMKKIGSGKIINLCGGGVGGSNVKPRISAYFTSKIAIAGFSEALAEELKDVNIQVNSISPGAANTYLNDYLLKQGPIKAGKEFYEQSLKQKKEGGTPLEFASQLVAFLASTRSDHISGRLLSAKWNPPNELKNIKFNQSLYKLRRIDQQSYYEKK